VNTGKAAQQKRFAIMFVGWGNKGVLAAEEACTRLPGGEDCDLYIVSDTAVSRESKAKNILVHFELPHFLRKAEAIVTHAPNGYEAILYLDSDVTILSDLNFLFAKSAQHGVAVAIAPTYSLDEFRGFAPIMLAEGIEPQGQLQYQAGVIGFSKTERVLAVLNTWLELCIRHAEYWDNDQPLLALAFETNRFQPYVLSKNYNLRGIFEPVIGRVRGWHSHSPIPANLNSYSAPYPPRLLARGKLRRLHRFEIDSKWILFLSRKYLLPIVYKAYLRIFRATASAPKES
jgi:hypothetical protein